MANVSSKEMRAERTQAWVSKLAAEQRRQPLASSRTAFMALRPAQKALVLTLSLLLVASSVWLLGPPRSAMRLIARPAPRLPPQSSLHPDDCRSPSPLVAKQCEWLERPPSSSPLGYEADFAFRRLLKPEDYDQTLEDFIRSSMPPSLQTRLLDDLRRTADEREEIPYVLHQTGQVMPAESDTMEWRRLNPGLNTSFVTADIFSEQVKDIFAGTEVLQAFLEMPLGVMNSDFFRQAVLLLEGGYYADSDVEPLQPLQTWHQLRVDEKSAYRPAFIVGIEENVDANGITREGEKWQDSWFGRPIQIVQWSFAAAPMHPISIDILRRFVEVSRAVRVWRAARDRELSFLGNSGSADRLRDRRVWEVLDILPSHRSGPAVQMILEWLGPVAQTDAVLSYIHRATGKTWLDVQAALADPFGDAVAFADVLVRPRISFGGWAADPFDAQKSLLRHNFRGRWISQLGVLDTL